MPARLRPASPVALVATVACWPLLTAGFAALLRSSECVRGTGLVGFVATYAARMREVADCPSGSLGYGPHTATILGVFAALAAALVLLHVAAALGGVWFARLVRSVRDGLVDLMRRRRVPEPTEVTTFRLDATDWVGRAVVAVRPERQVLRRGPPVLA